MFSPTTVALEQFDNPHEFERMCADILNALGYKDVVLLSKSGADRGIDITFRTQKGEEGAAYVTLRKNITGKLTRDFPKLKDGEIDTFILFCTTPLPASTKLTLAQYCLDTLQAKFVAYDMEALRSLLDNSLRLTREKYLNIYTLSNKESVQGEPASTHTIEVFLCYAHEDEALRQSLAKHLRPLQRQGLIDMWHGRDISAGKEWEHEIDKHLNTAQIILLLVSPDFLDSDYCYSKEMKRAMERHECGEARVIPVILRSVVWQGAPFGKLQALPTGAKPVKKWRDIDEAFSQVVLGILKVVDEIFIHAVPTPSEQEKLRRSKLLTKIRQLYIYSHDNISPGILAGTEPLPKEFVEIQLAKMGETWRQDVYL